MPPELPDTDSVAARMDRCEQRIGYEFTDRGLLQQALTHSSCASSRLQSNERLEFLGDAVLGMVICRYLYDHYPERREGQLTQQKSGLVSRSACARVAKDIGSAEVVLVGRGLQAIPESIDAGLVEALIAAVYLDGGIDAATSMILRMFDEELSRATVGEPENYKSLLQEETQRVSNLAPAYVLVDQRGPDHAREYCVAVDMDGERYESAWGRSKKEAEQKAALQALRVIRPELLESDHP